MKAQLQRLVFGCVAICAVILLFSGCDREWYRLKRRGPNPMLSQPKESLASQQSRRDSERARRQQQAESSGKEVIIGQDAHDLAITNRTVDGKTLMEFEIDENGEATGVGGTMQAVEIMGTPRKTVNEINGKIIIDFWVHVPVALLYGDWQLVLSPEIREGRHGDVVPLDPLVFTGYDYRMMQAEEYEQYRDFRTGQYEDLRRYVHRTDRNASRHIAYVSDPSNKYDHLEDYLAPRYIYDSVQVLPGGEIYKRLDGQYDADEGQAREAWLQRLAVDRKGVRRQVNDAPQEDVRVLARERLDYTNRERPRVMSKLLETDSMVVKANMSRPRYYLLPEEMEEGSGTAASAGYSRYVRHPYYPNARLDTTFFALRDQIGHVDTVQIYNPRTDAYDSMLIVRRFTYRYAQTVQANEHTDSLWLWAKGGIENTVGRVYRLKCPDTLIYRVLSARDFVDTTIVRYVKHLEPRDVVENESYTFTFARGKSVLDTTTHNRLELIKVRDKIRALMTDPVYEVDGITLTATASPEGSWRVNERLANERARTLRKEMIGAYKPIYDSLFAATYIDQAYVWNEATGESVVADTQSSNDALKAKDLNAILKAESIAEDWEMLFRMVRADSLLRQNEELLKLVRDEQLHPDAREARIHHRFPEEYAYMRANLYPEMRAVNFKFDLRRRGATSEWIVTTVLDTAYARAVTLLKKRKYDEAVSILNREEYLGDINRAIALMSADYTRGAYNSFLAIPDVENDEKAQFLMAICAWRLGEREKALEHYNRAVQLNPMRRHNANQYYELQQLKEFYRLDRF